MTARQQRWGVDGNEANVSRRVGSNVYAYELLSAMELQLRERDDVEVVVFLAQPPLSDLPPARPGWSYQVVPHAPLWTQTKLPFALARAQLDVFFSPGHYTPLWSPVPMVAAIMDLAFEHFPTAFRVRDRWQLALLTRATVDHAQELLVISEATRRDVHKTYATKNKPLNVVYPAVKNVKKNDLTQSTPNLKRWKIRRPYILHIGTLQPRKNIIGLITAFELLREQGVDVQLVLVGKVGWHGEPIAQRIATSSHREDIVWTDFVSDAEKQFLLEQSDILACVGLYEGFGIPALEAIVAGVLPVVSATTSLPEVVGPDGVMVDPHSPERMAAGFLQVLQLSQSERKSLVQKLQKYVQRFSWAVSAEKTIAILERVAQKRV